MAEWIFLYWALFRNNRFRIRGGRGEVGRLDLGIVDCCLGLADDWLSVVARNIVVPHTVVVEVVQHGQTILIALSVVGLGPVGTTGVGPLVGGGSSARGPPDGRLSAVVDETTSPEVFLALSGNQTCEMILLVGVVQRNRFHTSALAEGSSLTMSE